MPVQVRCPQCKKLCQVQSEHVGQAVRCPQCSQVFLPAGDAPAAATVPARPGFWTGLRGMFRGAATPVPTAQPSDPELELHLDGPMAAAMLEAPAEPPRVRGVRLDIGSATTAGRVRPRNEDSCLVQQLSWANLDQQHTLALAVIADGMGGYQAGDKASALVVRQFAEAFTPVVTAALGRVPSGAELADLIDRTLKDANRLVRQQGETDSACKGMGATAAAVAA